MTSSLSHASRVALITGASAGIGKASALRLLKSGWKVIAVARRKDRLDALAQEYPDQVYPLSLDLQNLPQITQIESLIPEEYRSIELLLNNAGLALGVERAQNASWEAWNTQIQTNISALVSLTHTLLPGMIRRGRGHILNLGSIAGTYPYPGGNVYGATKAFVKQFSLNLKADLLGTPLRVTVLEPGMVETEFSEVRFAGDAQKAKAVYEGMTPLTADDIAECVHWCAHLPEHVNINILEIMPTQQAFSPFAVDRNNPNFG